MREIWSRNCGTRPEWALTPRAIVVHASGNGSLGGLVSRLLRSESRASAHYAIGKDGEVVQMVPDERRAWHTGEGHLRGIPDVDAFSIGIELVNRNDGRDAYPAGQIAALDDLLAVLMRKYGIRPADVVGHHEASNRWSGETDPAGLDMAALRASLAYGRDLGPEVAKPRYIHGLHGAGGERLMADLPGWLVFDAVVGDDPGDDTGRDWTYWADQGYGVIAVLQYGEEAALPGAERYDRFARRCASFAANSKGCHIWAIGDGPDAQATSPDGYAACYCRCREAMKRVPGHFYDEVATAAVGAPAYLGEALKGIEVLAGTADAISLHAYTARHDPEEAAHLGFWSFADLMAAVPCRSRDQPVYVTEVRPIEEERGWLDVNNGYASAALEAFARWNEGGGQRIQAAVFYRWPRNDWWRIAGRQDLQRDIREAVLRGYAWR